MLVNYLLCLQDLMKGAPETPNVVEACNLEGRQERLDGLLGQLEMCEKALQVHDMCCVHGLATHDNCRSRIVSIICLS